MLEHADEDLVLFNVKVQRLEDVVQEYNFIVNWRERCGIGCAGVDNCIGCLDWVYFLDYTRHGDTVWVAGSWLIFFGKVLEKLFLHIC